MRERIVSGFSQEGERLPAAYFPSFESSCFENVEKFIDSLEQKIGYNWPKNLEAQNSIKESAREWFNGLPPALKRMLAEGILALDLGSLSAGDGQPMEIMIQPGSIEKSEDYYSVGRVMFEVDKVLNNESRTKAFDRLHSLSEDYEVVVANQRGLQLGSVADYQSALALLDGLLIKGLDPTSLPFRELLDQPKFSELKTALNLPEPDVRGSVARRNFEREWPDEKITALLNLRVAVPDAFDLSKDERIPRRVTNNLNSALSAKYREKKIVEGLSEGVGIEIEFISREHVKSPDPLKWSRLTARQFKTELVLLEKLSTLLTSLKDEQAIVDYLRALQASPSEETTLLKALKDNAGRGVGENIELAISTGGGYRFKTSELRKIYAPGYEGFTDLCAFFQKHEKLWNRIKAHARATPKT